MGPGAKARAHSAGVAQAVARGARDAARRDAEAKEAEGNQMCKGLSYLKFCVRYTSYPDWDYRSVLKCSDKHGFRI